MQWPAFFTTCLKERPCRRNHSLILQMVLVLHNTFLWLFFRIIEGLSVPLLDAVWCSFTGFLSIPQACPDVLCPCPHSEQTVPLQPGAMTFSYFMSSTKLKFTYPTCFSHAIWWNKCSHQNSWLLFQICLLFSTSVRDISVGLVIQARTSGDPGSPFLLQSLSGM